MPRELSGGQRQRVAVGRAIIRKVDIFLMDEPLSNLDAKLKDSMRRELMLLHDRRKATMIYVTHDQTEALILADRIVCMSNGYVQQIGTPIELYDHPANLFVARFIGLPPMNFIDVKVQKGRLLNDYLNIPVPKRYANSLVEYEDKEVVLGIRPEDIVADGDDDDDEVIAEDGVFFFLLDGACLLVKAHVKKKIKKHRINPMQNKFTAIRDFV